MLYHCNPPLDGHDFVVVSTITDPPQTAIFAAHIEPVRVESQGMTVDWGSIQPMGVGDHASALLERGYEIKNVA